MFVMFFCFKDSMGTDSVIEGVIQAASVHPDQNIMLRIAVLEKV